MHNVRSYAPRATASTIALTLLLILGPATDVLANSGSSQTSAGPSKKTAMPAAYTRGLAQVEAGDLKGARSSFER